MELEISSGLEADFSFKDIMSFATSSGEQTMAERHDSMGSLFMRGEKQTDRGLVVGRAGRE